MAVLPVFIADSAWVHEPEWMMTGLKIWGSEGFAFERDYLLPLPRPDFSGCLQRRAEYSDASTFSQKLLGSLVDYDGNALLDHATLGYWSEHSERAGVDTWLAAVGVGADMRNFIGRWAVKGSADVYARTAIRITESLQGKAALYAQVVQAGGADHFGEEHALHEMSAWLRKKGVDSDRIEDQVWRLTVADFTQEVCDIGSKHREDAPAHASPPPSSAPLSPSTSFNFFPEEVLSWRALPEPDSDTERDLGCFSPAADSCQSGDTELVSSDAANDDDSDEVSEPKLAVAQELRRTEQEAQKPTGFVVVRTDKGRMRRLHFVGGCYRVPEEHYLDYTVWGDQLPDASEIDARCKQCFKDEGILRRQLPTSGALSDISSADEADSSSNSDSTGVRARSPTPTSHLRGPARAGAAWRGQRTAALK